MLWSRFRLSGGLWESGGTTNNCVCTYTCHKLITHNSHYSDWAALGGGVCVYGYICMIVHNVPHAKMHKLVFCDSEVWSSMRRWPQCINLYNSSPLLRRLTAVLCLSCSWLELIEQSIYTTLLLAHISSFSVILLSSFHLFAVNGLYL